MACLKLKVKQGEEKSIGFTIKQNNEPMSLENLTVHFQVKLDPTVSSKPIINKYITTNNAYAIYNIDGEKVNIPSDINKAGQITNPTNGVFQVHLDERDTSFPIGDYYLIISIEEYEDKLDEDGNVMYDDDNHIIKTISRCNIISSNCCNNAIYKICEQ